MHGENRSHEFREMVGAAPESRRGDPAADNRKNRQYSQWAEHAPGRLMDMNVVLVVALLSVESKKEQAEHVERGEQGGEQADAIKNAAAGVMTVADSECAEEDRVLGEKSRERREAGNGDRCDQHGPISDFDFFSGA